MPTLKDLICRCINRKDNQRHEPPKPPKEMKYKYFCVYQTKNSNNDIGTGRNFLVLDRKISGFLDIEEIERFITMKYSLKDAMLIDFQLISEG